MVAGAQLPWFRPHPLLHSRGCSDNLPDLNTDKDMLAWWEGLPLLPAGCWALSRCACRRGLRFRRGKRGQGSLASFWLLPGSASHTPGRHSPRKPVRVGRNAESCHLGAPPQNAASKYGLKGPEWLKNLLPY